ncbi:hypothetical protein GO986_17750 [Deinococcus sp. HMF7620]|uniref:Uncharacterized protein n=1 Tax=Deinococcus arboris TaxID=2682977 RepID=A0A7C9MAS2_9DEIO|nr:hypothetical protein [Deinococcus arboris]MVN88583.1 hypothetical protein [Deinococcus arboris]
MTKITDQPTYWYYDPENRAAPVRQLPWGTADQCNLSAPFQTQEAAELSRQAAHLAAQPQAWARAEEARRINAANGWGLGFELSHIPRYLALIHSEITEAACEAEPAKINHELGDVIVRALDLAHLTDPQATRLWFADPLNQSAVGTWGRNHPQHLWPTGALLYLHTITSRALEAYRKTEDDGRLRHNVVTELKTLVAYVVACMRVVQVDADPEAIVGKILAANATRGHRHGGRRA